jgi:two-component system sensor histidine kinase PrrB
VRRGCCIPFAAWGSCYGLSDERLREEPTALMAVLSRIFRRTPSLRTRVAFATAIAATIVVGIVGAVVWIGITNDRKERLDRRLDEAAGFAIPFLPRGLGEIPKSPNDQDAVITVRRGGQVTSNSEVVLPELAAGYADTYVDGVRYRVRTVELANPEPMRVAVGATYDATIADTNNLHRRVILICSLAIGAATVGAWLLAAFAVRPFKRLAQQTRSIDAGDEAPDIDIRGATEAVEIAEAMKGMLQRIWKEQDRTKAALTSARDFASVSAHELRTPLTAMRTNLEVLSTLDVGEEQRKEVVNDVIRTQSRIEATLAALERLAQGELSTYDDHVPVDITELLDRAAHDAMRVYPDLEVSLVPAPTMIILGLPAGLRLAVDNAIANAVKHGGATRVQLSAVSSRAGVEIAVDDNGVGVPEEERKLVFERFSRGSTASHSGSGLGLALVAQQAELHGGTASLEDSPLGGARLLLRLPGAR